MILVLDIDGTLADLSHREFLVADKAHADWDTFFSEDLLYKDAVIKNALEGYAAFYDVAAKVYVITGRPERTQLRTAEWLIEQGFDIARLLDNMIFRPDDLTMSSREFKRTVLESVIIPENPDGKYVFIDDDLRNLDMFAEYGLALKAPEIWQEVIKVK